ncbi:MAG: DUF4062 domain-containing protein [Treponema sp.]|jgi:hypothetical protein|nr:DUF4062 domain-containing protein [Treponema sp.]
MAANLIEDGRIRIFISSTFKDMQAERNHLVQVVFPSLYSYCAERNILLQALDLRWGITEEEEKRGKVVELCLKAIKNTRPFFIGLLGERYGWVPDEKKREEIAQKTSVFTEYPEVKAMLDAGMSITEVEIQQGVLQSPKNVHAYFYFRASYISPDNDDSRETDSTKIQRLEDLKKTLQNAYPVRNYEFPEGLGELVEKDFRELVDSLYLDEGQSAVKKDRLQQRFVLKSKTAVYVPGPELEALDRFTEGGGQCLVITGEGGIGKSALLANWIQNREGRNDEKILYNFIGQSNSLADFHFIGQAQYLEGFDIITKWLTYELMNAYGLDFMPIGFGGLKPYNDTIELQYQLNSIKDKGRIIIVLDGIDRLSNENGKMAAWLPELPPNVKLIVSMRKSRPETDFFAGINCGFVPVSALNIERRKKLIKEYLEYFGKALDEDQTEKIAAHEMNANPFALCTLLDELRVFGVFEELNNEIDRYLRARDVSALFTLVLERLEKAFNYDKDSNYVKDALSLIYVSGNGLSQLDIQKLTFSSSRNWSRLFCGLAGHLMILHGYVNFSHGFIREAVKRQYLPEEEDEREYRERLELFKNNAHAYYDKYN